MQGTSCGYRQAIITADRFDEKRETGKDMGGSSLCPRSIRKHTYLEVLLKIVCRPAEMLLYPVEIVL